MLVEAAPAPVLVQDFQACSWRAATFSAGGSAGKRPPEADWVPGGMPRRDLGKAVDSIWWTRATHLAGRVHNAPSTTRCR